MLGRIYAAYYKVIQTVPVEWSVPLSVGLSVTIVSLAETAGPIEMPLGVWTRVGTSTDVLDGDPDPPCKGAIGGGKGQPVVKYRDTLP